MTILSLISAFVSIFFIAVAPFIENLRDPAHRPIGDGDWDDSLFPRIGSEDDMHNIVVLPLGRDENGELIARNPAEEIFKSICESFDSIDDAATGAATPQALEIQASETPQPEGPRPHVAKIIKLYGRNGVSVLMSDGSKRSSFVAGLQDVDPDLREFHAALAFA